MTAQQDLVETLASVIELLQNCQMSDRAAWFSERLERISGNPSDKVLIEVAHEVRSVIAGFGSYTDLSLQPTIESGISEMEAQEIQWRLADRLDAATSKILKNR